MTTTTSDHGGMVLFEVPFRSSLNSHKLELLRRQLAITSHVEHKLPVDPNSPGHAQLDRDTSLLLEHGSGAEDWVLQARTWARPSERAVHDWQVLVSDVAHQLDPKVKLLEPMPAESYAVSMRRVGHAANTRWAAARRRLTGLR